MKAAPESDTTDRSFTFVSYGVRVRVEADGQRDLAEIGKRLETALPGEFHLRESSATADLGVRVERTPAGQMVFYFNGEEYTTGDPYDGLLDYLESIVRVNIGERAASRAFIHAGAVACEGRALILPGHSYSGKSTLVGELVRRGAEYMSDEYAVFDEQGLVHPFPKTISMREPGGHVQTEMEVASFGGRSAQGPCEPLMIIFTEYAAGREFEPETVTPGEGILEMLKHSLSIRSRPEHTLKILKRVASRAIICRSFRGEASEDSQKILDYFVKNT